MSIYRGIATYVAAGILFAESASASTIEPKVNVSLTVVDSCRTEADHQDVHVSCSASVPVRVEMAPVAMQASEEYADVREVTITY